MDPRAEARARLKVMRKLRATLETAYAKIPVAADAADWHGEELARLGLTPAEIAAVTASTWQAERFRSEYAAKADKLRPPKPTSTLEHPRIGPKMREIADYVAGSPGCTISEALRAVGISPRDRSSARAPVYRAEAAGLIIFDRVRVNLVRVFENERAREIWYLRKELLEPGQPVARIEELQAQIDELRADAARTWVTD